MDGGAEVVNTLLRYGLFDEYSISTIPIFLGVVIALFNGSRPEEKLEPIAAKHFESGLVQLHYQERRTVTAHR